MIKTIQKVVFDKDDIKENMLIFAKHNSWTKGRAGIVRGVDDTSLTIMTIGDVWSVYQHFFIKVEDVEDGTWLIRYSEDLEDVKEVVPNETE